MNSLEELAAVISQNYTNIHNSKNRPRTLQGIEEKKRLLEDSITEYKRILKTFEHRLTKDDWIEQVTTYEAIKTKYQLAIKLLDNTIIRSSRISFKT